MQHTHTLKAPLSADAILNDYLAQQHNLTLKRSPVSLQTAHKQQMSPPPHSPFVLNCALNQAKTKSKQAAAYKQQSSRSQHQSSPGNETTPSDESFESSHHDQNTSGGIAQVQRKLLTFFFIYIVIIATLFFTYAVYCYHQQSTIKRQMQQQQLQDQVTQTTPAADQVLGSHALVSADSSADLAPETRQALEALQAKMDNKLHLLERYLEVLAIDLEDTRTRLREREKCACSIGCSFNGTRYTDGQRWTSAESKCDVCSCQAGKISCSPRECPKLAANCESPVQLPGQCCPTCMKKCKLNQSLVSHGHTFKPTPVEGDNSKPTKLCKCYNGLIKCEPINGKSATTSTAASDQKLRYQKLQPMQAANAAAAAAAKNKTLEYLNSIIAPHQQVLAQNERHRAAAAAAAR